MELDELKKSWNKLDQHLENREFIREEEIQQLIHKTSGKIQAFAIYSRRMIIFAVILILLVAIGVFDSDYSNNLHYIIVIIIAVPAIGWDLFTLRYLRQTRIEEMTLIEVITRINRIHKWAIQEQFLGIPLILCIAASQFITRHVWEEKPAMIITFFVIWTLAASLAFWAHRKFTINRIREIKKNLDEIHEVNEINDK